MTKKNNRGSLSSADARGQAILTAALLSCYDTVRSETQEQCVFVVFLVICVVYIDVDISVHTVYIWLCTAMGCKESSGHLERRCTASVVFESIDFYLSSLS